MKFLSTILIFALFLQPFHYGSVSVNYLFVFYPLFIILLKQRFIIPANSILICICLFYSILFFGFILQPEYLHFGTRRFISFILFIFSFSFSFIKIDEKIVNAFKMSIILGSLIVMLPFIFSLLSVGLENLGWGSKNEYGAQRYGFIYVMAFWLVLMFKHESKYILGLKIILLPTIVLGTLILFNRSSIVSLFGSLVIYFLYNTIIHKSSIRKKIGFICFSTIAMYFLFLAVNNYVPFIITFFEKRLFLMFEFSTTSGLVFEDTGSESYRIDMFKRIIDFISNNILIGSGFLGVWVLFSDLSGSTHNQYTDILFRTGLLGSLLYLYLIARITKYTFSNHKDLFFGLVGVLIYGLFHETFKLSQGGFIFAFLIAISFQKQTIMQISQEKYQLKALK